MTPGGFQQQASAYDVRVTTERLINAISAQGMQLFARVDHTAAAAVAGLTLPPTELLIFGNARAGTPLMSEARTIAIDLPLKAIIWADGADCTWVGYNEPEWIGRRHGLDPGHEGVLQLMTAKLLAVVAAAIGPSGS